MIAYLENNEDKKEMVFARVIGDRNLIRKKIDDSKYGSIVDKYCLKKYVNESMLINHNGFNESMFCDPNDVMENIGIDFIMLEMIFSDDYDKYIKNAEEYASRLLILKSDVMPFIKLEEMDRLSYDEGFYNENFDKMLNLNTEILKLVNSEELEMDIEKSQSKVKTLKKD